MRYFVWYSGYHRNTTDSHYYYHIILCYITTHILWYEIFLWYLCGNLGITGIPQTPILITMKLYMLLQHITCCMRSSCGILCGNIQWWPKLLEHQVNLNDFSCFHSVDHLNTFKMPGMSTKVIIIL